jgi:hypothetical protein
MFLLYKSIRLIVIIKNLSSVPSLPPRNFSGEFLSKLLKSAINNSGSNRQLQYAKNKCPAFDINHIRYFATYSKTTIALPIHQMST